MISVSTKQLKTVTKDIRIFDNTMDRKTMVKFVEMDENFKPVKTYERKQSELTSDCLLIQFKGLAACVECELKNKPDCGGGETLKQMIIDEGGK